MTWATDLLAEIGAPATDANVRVCDLWAASEGTLVHNNPFAISGHFAGATACLAQCGTPSEVMAYDTMAHGVAATAAFMDGSYYVGIVESFRHDVGESALWEAINASPWCRGCQGGKYPIALYNYVSGLPLEPPEDTPMCYDPDRKQLHGIFVLNGKAWHCWQETQPSSPAQAGWHYEPLNTP